MRVYNTLSGQKEEFSPRGEEVKMYVCGVNPYSDAHIGHAMSYILFDVVRRYLEFRDYKVRHVENVTDIEDNIIAQANRLGITVRELTDKYTARYFEDMDALNILRPHHTPKATETIPEIIDMTQGLIDKGFAYAVGGDVYFRVRNVPDYGRLSRRNLDSMMAGARIEPGEGKEYPMDFVLWKAAKPDEPSWESPWGQGRPGWHIECSAMSLKYLGESIDIHGGGQDLIFPHHENEIAQSESFTGVRPFVKHWLHNGMMQMGAEKMSKSLGNLITIREALEKYSADAIRIFVLSSHYRSPLTYSEEALEAAAKGADRLVRAYSQSSSGEGIKEPPYTKAYKDQFIAAMDDDFNTARALARVFELAAVINRAADSGRNIEEAKHLLRQLACDILGLTLKPPEKPNIDPEPLRQLLASINNKLLKAELSGIPVVDRLPYDVESLMELLTSSRSGLRDAKLWELADEIRVELTKLDIALEDTPQGTVWRYKR